MRIDVTFDQSQSSLPTGFVSAVDYVVNTFDALFTANVTINIHVGYGEIDGQSLGSNDLGESYAPQYVLENYASVRSALQAQGAPGAASLPTSSPLSGSLYMPQSEAQALGLTSAVSASYVGFSSGLPFSYALNTTPAASQFYFVGVVEHELTETMGRVSLLDGQPSYYSTMDLFRYSAPGTRTLATGGEGSTAYFSIDGGVTNLGTWNNNASNGDLGDWYPQGPAAGGNDSFNDYSSPGVINALSANDITLMEALGWSTLTNEILVTATTAEALQGGAAITLLTSAPIIIDTGKTTLAGATIKITNGSNSPVAGDELYVNGQQSGTVDGATISWNDSTKVLTLTGNVSIATYETLLSEITYKDTGTNSSSGSHPERTVSWSVSDGTNSYSTISQIAVDRPPVANNDIATVVAGATVTKSAAAGILSNDTDLDNDTLSLTGVSDTAHSAGTVGQSLAGVYGHLTLNADGSYSYVADTASAIAAAPAGSHPVDTFTYTESDGNGGAATATVAVTIDRPPVVTAANMDLTAGHGSVAASSLFIAADPDGDAIVTYGFMDSGPGEFLLNSVAQADNQAIDVTAAQLSQLVYQSVGGTADTLEIRTNDGTTWSNWSSFTVVAPPLVIQTNTSSFGTTSLTEVGGNYFLYDDGSGPELKYGGADVVAGTLGGWTPIGAVQTATGYDVAWKMAGADEYTVWATDTSGNYASNVIGAVPGNNTALESLETTFGQDLNGNSVIGIPVTVVQTDTSSFGTTNLADVGGDYFLYDNGLGPALQYDGADIVSGTFGGWAPIGAVQTATGYDVAWKVAGADEYTVWATDISGNYVANVVGAVPGNSTALEALETTFGQDLNGDGVIGIPSTVIQIDGTTSLTEVGNNYFLYDNGSGPALQYDGADVAAGTLGGWTPIGAVQTATGYDVAWKMAGVDEYTAWATNAAGNYVSNVIGAVPGNSTALESLETIFGQDLNGDGVIGIPTTVIRVDGATSLTEVGNNYFLYDNGSGPALQYDGADVVAGAFGGWTPIGAVQTATGYDVAWKMAGVDEYTVWATNAAGNYVSNVIGAVPGNSTALEALETTFGQDLNGDGVIGVPEGNSFALQYKGFDYVAFFIGAYEDSDSLPSLVQTGANSIEATLDYGIDAQTSQVVADPNYTDSLTALGNTIAQAESLGLSVMVRPLIDFLNPSESAPYSVGDWRQDYEPTNVATFFASYKQMLVAEAEVAQQNGAQMFSIGAELDQLAGSQYLSYWTDIINSVRAVFSGALTYSASWDTANQVSFWSQLNYEGIDCYVPLSNAANPTLQQLINGWLNPATQATNPGAYAVIGNESPIQYFENLAAQSGKPLIFTELGYANDSGAAADPSASGNSPDPSLQAELYQAFFQAWEQSGSSSLIGTYLWEWDPNGSTSNVGPGIDSFSPQNSPAQAQATAGFEALNSSVGTNEAAPTLDANISGTFELASGTTTLVDDGAVTNNGNIQLNGLLVVDDTASTLSGAGTVTMAGGTLEGAAPGETLNNMGNTISGFGTIGDGSGHLALDNASGTIEADGGMLTIDTGTTITNTGLLAATAGANLQVEDPVTGTGATTIGAGATVEFGAGYSGSVTFQGSTGMLRIDDAPTFNGEIFNFGGDGTLAGSDQIDLRDINFNTVHDSYTNGVLTVTDGTDTATLDFNGSYVLANFKFASDGSGGTIVYDPPVPASTTALNQKELSHIEVVADKIAPTASASSLGFMNVGSHDTFVFPSNFSGTAAADHASSPEAPQLAHGEFADLAAMLATAHNNHIGNVAVDAFQTAFTSHSVGVDQSHQGHFIIS